MQVKRNRRDFDADLHKRRNVAEAIGRWSGRMRARTRRPRDCGHRQDAQERPHPHREEAVGISHHKGVSAGQISNGFNRLCVGKDGARFCRQQLRRVDQPGLRQQRAVGDAVADDGEMIVLAGSS
jgi:hypothetical protein